MHWGGFDPTIRLVLEAGLGFPVKLDKPGGFIGRDALLRQKEHGIPGCRLIPFVLDDPEPLLYHGEALWRNDERVGFIRAGAYCHTRWVPVSDGATPSRASVPAKTTWRTVAGRSRVHSSGIRRHPRCDPSTSYRANESKGTAERALWREGGRASAVHSRESLPGEG